MNKGESVKDEIDIKLGKEGRLYCKIIAEMLHVNSSDRIERHESYQNCKKA